MGLWYWFVVTAMVMARVRGGLPCIELNHWMVGEEPGKKGERFNRRGTEIGDARKREGWLDKGWRIERWSSKHQDYSRSTRDLDWSKLTSLCSYFVQYSVSTKPTPNRIIGFDTIGLTTCPTEICHFLYGSHCVHCCKLQLFVGWIRSYCLRWDFAPRKFLYTSGSSVVVTYPLTMRLGNTTRWYERNGDNCA